MRVAVPVSSNMQMFHSNPCAAPMYLIYTIDADKKKRAFVTYEKLLPNPSYKEARKLECDCNAELAEEMEHKIWHYTIADILYGCDYVLADYTCTNTKRSLQVAGIKLYTIPSIINQSQLAIKNFIIGEHFADNIQNIYNVS